MLHLGNLSAAFWCGVNYMAEETANILKESRKYNDKAKDDIYLPIETRESSFCQEWKESSTN